MKHRFTQRGSNRITALDKSALTYYNEQRYPGETLREFYDRLLKRYKQIYPDSYGINSTRQGMLNSFYYHFNLNKKHINSETFFNTTYVPIDRDPITGEEFDISLYVNDIEHDRLGSHEDNIHDSGLSGYVYSDTYKNTSMFDDIADTGFVVWRHYNGNLSNIIELNTALSATEVKIQYHYWNNEVSKSIPIEEVFDIDEPFTNSETYDIIPVDESHLYTNGIMTDEIKLLIQEYFRKAKRHWGYITIDETILGTRNYETRKLIECSDILDTGGLYV